MLVFVIMTTAQDLMEQWTAEKLNFNDDYLDSDYLAIPANTAVQTSKTATEISREWDRLTEPEGDDCFTSTRDAERKVHSSRNCKQQKNNGRKSIS